MMAEVRIEVPDDVAEALDGLEVSNLDHMLDLVVLAIGVTGAEVAAESECGRPAHYGEPAERIGSAAVRLARLSDAYGEYGGQLERLREAS